MFWSARLRRRNPPALDADVAELRPDVGDHAVVRGRGRAQDRHVGGHSPQHAHQALVIGSEVVSPVRNAMRLVDHEQAGAPRHRHEDVLCEALVGKPLGRYQEHIDAVLVQLPLDFRPIVAVRRIDRAGSQTQAPGGRDLVVHQGKQRRNDQGGSAPSVAQQARRDEIDEALAPARPLHDKQPLAPVGQGLDSLELALAKYRRPVVQRRSEKGERFRFIHRNGTSP